jgi:hypothetical protein
MKRKGDKRSKKKLNLKSQNLFLKWETDVNSFKISHQWNLLMCGEKERQPINKSIKQ